MQVCSTRDPSVRLSFSASLLAGLPPGGGLYQPDPPPNLRREIAALSDRASFQEVAAAAISRLFEEELASSSDGPAAAARALVEAAFPFVPALSRLHDDIVLLELFHGPTCAFKDFGASFLATLLERRLRASPAGQGVVVLVATSGDTGGAVARAFGDAGVSRWCCCIRRAASAACRSSSSRRSATTSTPWRWRARSTTASAW